MTNKQDASTAIKLLPCPCGETPSELCIQDNAQGGKWALAFGDCCNEWMIEFRAEYHPLDSVDCMSLAIEAWNLSRRKPVADLTDLEAEKQCDDSNVIADHSGNGAFPDSDVIGMPQEYFDLSQEIGADVPAKGE